MKHGVQDPMQTGGMAGAGQRLAGGHTRLSQWRAGHLPPAFTGKVSAQTLAFGDLTITVPAPDAAQMQALADHVARATREVLRPLPVSTLIGHIDRAVVRLLDPQDPWRQLADELLPRVTGYDAQMVTVALTGYLQQFRAPQLHRFVAEDFANPKVLDEFQPAAKGGAVRALGPNLLAHSWAGNVPGLPLWSLACGLLVKAGGIGKLPSAEPVFASLFAQLLAEVHPPLSDALAVVWWKGGEDEPAASLYRAADCVLAYGGNEAIAQVRAQVPATTRFLPYGHKLGVALVGREVLDRRHGPALARAAAHDVTRYEQQGCYSPHVVYVERGGLVDPRSFAQHLAAELAAQARQHPRRLLGLEETAAVSSWQQTAEMRSLREAGQELLGDASALAATRGSTGAAAAAQGNAGAGPASSAKRGEAERAISITKESASEVSAPASWFVAYADRPLPLAPSAGWRCVQVVAVDTLDEALALLAPHALFLQTAAVAVAPASLYPLAERLAQAGITRVTALGRMTAPEAGWHHDGSFNLASLVRMVDLEMAAERAADRLAPYAQEDAP